MMSVWARYGNGPLRQQARLGVASADRMGVTVH